MGIWEGHILVVLTVLWTAKESRYLLPGEQLYLKGRCIDSVNLQWENYLATGSRTEQFAETYEAYIVWQRAKYFIWSFIRVGFWFGSRVNDCGMGISWTSHCVQMCTAHTNSENRWIFKGKNSLSCYLYESSKNCPWGNTRLSTSILDVLFAFQRQSLDLLTFVFLTWSDKQTE